jgi:hypothetical protein
VSKPATTSFGLGTVFKGRLEGDRPRSCAVERRRSDRKRQKEKCQGGDGPPFEVHSHPAVCLVPPSAHPLPPFVPSGPLVGTLTMPVRRRLGAKWVWRRRADRVLEETWFLASS